MGAAPYLFFEPLSLRPSESPKDPSVSVLGINRMKKIDKYAKQAHKHRYTDVGCTMVKVRPVN